MNRSHRLEFSPDGLAFPGMSQCVRVGDTAYVSGQVSLGPDGALLGRDDAAIQSEQCFVNLSNSLDGVGMTLQDVVKLTCYLADLSHYPAYASAKAKFMREVSPAATAVVTGLLDPGFCLEIEAVAVRRSDQ